MPRVAPSSAVLFFLHEEDPGVLKEVQDATRPSENLAASGQHGNSSVPTIRRICRPGEEVALSRIDPRPVREPAARRKNYTK